MSLIMGIVGPSEREQVGSLYHIRPKLPQTLIIWFCVRFLFEVLLFGLLVGCYPHLWSLGLNKYFFYKYSLPVNGPILVEALKWS